MSRYYTLTPEHDIVPTDDVHVWGRFIDDPKNVRVAETTVGDLWASTVFLGVDHSFRDGGPPVLFETMVFNHAPDKNPWDEQICERYATWAEAEVGHERIVADLRAGRQP